MKEVFVKMDATINAHTALMADPKELHLVQVVNSGSYPLFKQFLDTFSSLKDSVLKYKAEVEAAKSAQSVQQRERTEYTFYNTETLQALDRAQLHAVEQLDRVRRQEREFKDKTIETIKEEARDDLLLMHDEACKYFEHAHSAQEEMSLYMEQMVDSHRKMNDRHELFSKELELARVMQKNAREYAEREILEQETRQLIIAHYDQSMRKSEQLLLAHLEPKRRVQALFGVYEKAYAHQQDSKHSKSNEQLQPKSIDPEHPIKPHASKTVGGQQQSILTRTEDSSTKPKSPTYTNVSAGIKSLQPTYRAVLQKKRAAEISTRRKSLPAYINVSAGNELPPLSTKPSVSQPRAEEISTKHKSTTYITVVGTNESPPVQPIVTAPLERASSFSPKSSNTYAEIEDAEREAPLNQTKKGRFLSLFKKKKN